MAVQDSVKALADLGFTNLEAEIYSFLIQESPATGYRIAQAIGKPAANTYKAIQTLEQKGAIIVEDGTSRMCRAVSSDELLTRLSREFESKRSLAHQSLSHLNQASPDDRIYQIRSKEQVFQRSREMISEAEKVVLGVIIGPFTTHFADELLAATTRGVDIALKSDHAIRIEGVEIVPDETQDWGGQTLQLVIDGDQTLVAGFDSKGNLTQAIWSRNPVLAITHHKGLASSLCLTSLANRIEEGAGSKRIARTLASLRLASETPGFRRISS